MNYFIFQLVDWFSLDWVHSRKGRGSLDVQVFMLVDTAAHVFNICNLFLYVTPWNVLLVSALTAVASKFNIFNENSGWCDPNQIPDKIRKRLQTIT